MTVTEDQLKFWARPPNEAQEKRCKNAEDMIRNAIQTSGALSRRNINIFPARLIREQYKYGAK